MDLQNLWELLAGLGIFLFGMFLLEEAIRNMSGRTFKKFIRKSTEGTFRSVLAGTTATAILQSSLAVSLMVLTFVGAGVMTLQNAIGVIIGSNLGTTLTSWIVATFGFKLNIEAFSLPFIGIGGLGLIFLGKNQLLANISRFLVGFGFLFMGLSYMKGGMDFLSAEIDLTDYLEYGILVYVIAGFVLTFAVQSSSASMAIILSSLHSDIIPFHIATAMVIGSNLGTTITILLSSLGADSIKKRVAYSHFFFNFFTAIVALLLIPVFVWIIKLIINIETDAVIGLALFHTIFNLTGILLIVPFLKKFTTFIIKLVPEKKKTLAKFTLVPAPAIPEAGIIAIRQEAESLIINIMHHNLLLLKINIKNISLPGKDKKINQSPILYSNIKTLQTEIFTYSAHIQQAEMTKEETDELYYLMSGIKSAVQGAKILKDVKHEFDAIENSTNDIIFSEYENFQKKVENICRRIIKVIESENNEYILNELVKLQHEVTENDRNFLKYLSGMVANEIIDSRYLSNLISSNRGYVTSFQSIIKALVYIKLLVAEAHQFDQMQEQGEWEIN